MSPGHYTELFLLDEAVALAAGHRPCAESSLVTKGIGRRMRNRKGIVETEIEMVQALFLRSVR
jgi:hypothetical protein